MRSLRPSCALPPTLACALALLVATACAQRSPLPLKHLPDYVPEYGEGFSAQRSWHDLEALTAIGPRVTGSEGARKAREYIAGQLESLGLEVEQHEVPIELGEGHDPLVATNLTATVPGESPDLIVLMAPYDTRPFENFEFVGANDGGSGPALLLELARTLKAKPLRYTTRFVFLDAEASRPDPTSESGSRELRMLGSAQLASEMAEQDLLTNTRLLVYFNKVADADLRVARDLYSHRIYREDFWAAAARLGYTDAFPQDRGFESVKGGHHAFRSAGLRRVVAIVDTSYGGDAQPGVYADSEEDTTEHLSPESLAIVGQVTLDALDNISERLAKIDRFSKAPLSEPEYNEPVPPAPVLPAEAPIPDRSAPITGTPRRPADENPYAPLENAGAKPAPPGTSAP